MRSARFYYLLAALIVLLDQGAKLAVKGFNLFGLSHEGMQQGESIRLIGEFVRLTYIENKGMAFGLNFGMPVVLSLFSIAAAIALVVLIRRTTQPERRWLRLALALILAGAVGNMIDRTFYGVFYGYESLFYGHVVDFIDVNPPAIDLFGKSTRLWVWVFNIADAAVTAGMVLLIFTYPALVKRAKQEKEAAPGSVNEPPALPNPAP